MPVIRYCTRPSEDYFYLFSLLFLLPCPRFISPDAWKVGAFLSFFLSFFFPSFLFRCACAVCEWPSSDRERYFFSSRTSAVLVLVHIEMSKCTDEIWALTCGGFLPQMYEAGDEASEEMNRCGRRRGGRKEMFDQDTRYHSKLYLLLIDFAKSGDGGAEGSGFTTVISMILVYDFTDRSSDLAEQWWFIRVQ